MEATESEMSSGGLMYTVKSVDLAMVGLTPRLLTISRVEGHVPGKTTVVVKRLVSLLQVDVALYSFGTLVYNSYL